MYVMTRGPRPKRRLQKAMALALLLAVGVGSVFAGRQYFQSDTQIAPPPAATVTKVLAAETSVKKFDAGPITLALPKDWEPYRAPNTPATAYSWQNTAKDKGARVLTAYVDALPTSPMPVNRVLAVEPTEDRIQQLGGVSDNCVDFIEGGRSPRSGNGTVIARWGGVQFLCDNASYNRNVVGISSAGMVNGVTVTSPSGAKHKVFLVFNDMTVSPRHDIFTSAVESLRVR